MPGWVRGGLQKKADWLKRWWEVEQFISNHSFPRRWAALLVCYTGVSLSLHHLKASGRERGRAVHSTALQLLSPARCTPLLSGPPCVPRPPTEGLVAPLAAISGPANIYLSVKADLLLVDEKACVAAKTTWTKTLTKIGVLLLHVSQANYNILVIKSIPQPNMHWLCTLSLRLSVKVVLFCNTLHSFKTSSQRCCLKDLCIFNVAL